MSIWAMGNKRSVVLMKKVFRTILLIVLIIAGLAAGYRGIGRSTVSMDSLLTFCTAKNGETIAAWNERSNTVIARLRPNGTINSYLKFRTERKDAMYQILGVASGEKYTYVLRDKVDRYDGSIRGQELMVIDFDRMDQCIRQYDYHHRNRRKRDQSNSQEL